MSNDTPIPFPARADVQEDLRGLFRGAIRFSLEAFFEEQLVEMIGAERYQRVTHRRDTRNGSYLRRLLTSLGHVDVNVPRSRENGSPGAESIGRYGRRSEEVDAAIWEAYVGGVSTRGMGRVAEALTGQASGPFSSMSRSMRRRRISRRINRQPAPNPGARHALRPDAYRVSSNEAAPAAHALERTAMLVGDPVASPRRAAPSLPGFGLNVLTPSDLDGPTPPPAGSQSPFMRHRDDWLQGPVTARQDILEIREHHVDWMAPAMTMFTGPINATVGESDSVFRGAPFDCLPQPMTAQGTDALREPITRRLQYRDCGGHEFPVGSFVTDVHPAAGNAPADRACRLPRLPGGARATPRGRARRSAPALGRSFGWHGVASANLRRTWAEQCASARPRPARAGLEQAPSPSATAVPE